MMISKAVGDIRGLVLDEQAMVYVLNYPQIKLLMTYNTMTTTMVADNAILSIFNIYISNVNISKLNIFQFAISNFQS